MNALVPDLKPSSLPNSGVPQMRAMNENPSDDLSALILAIATQDRTAFAKLFRHFAPRIKTYLLRRGLENALADELAQEAMLIVWHKAPLFNPNHASAQAWLFTIVRHLWIDLRRRQHCAANLPPDDLPTIPQADALLEASDSARQVRAALDRLPPEQVEAVRLAFFDDYSHAHIEAALGIPLGTVKSRIRTAIIRLRAMLENKQ